jgi:hypothetical protein
MMPLSRCFRGFVRTKKPDMRAHPMILFRLWYVFFARFTSSFVSSSRTVKHAVMHISSQNRGVSMRIIRVRERWRERVRVCEGKGEWRIQ